MALPSARRPQVLEEELKERIKEQEQAKLVLSVAPKVTFEKSLSEWFGRQSRVVKNSLTPLILKRQAVRICATLNLVYFDLPPLWVERFKNQHGVRFKTVKKRKKMPKTKPTPSKRARLQLGELNEALNEAISNEHSTLEKDLMLSSSEDEGKEKLPTKLRKSSGSGGSTSTETLVQSPLSPVGTSQPGKQKKFLDLTDDLAPPSWLEAYARGKVLPRVLSIYSTEDTNILYYDYSPKLKDKSGKEVKLGVEKRDGDQMADILKLLQH